jgi:hypothetical protein
LSARSLIEQSRSIAACSMRQVLQAIHRHLKLATTPPINDCDVMPCGAGELEIVLMIISIAQPWWNSRTDCPARSTTS